MCDMGRPRKTNSHLPKRVYEKRGLYYFVTSEGKWLPLGSSLESAAAQARTLTPKPAQLSKEIRAHLSRALSRARERAKKRRQEFSLTIADVKQLWARARGCCELTNLPFRFERDAGFTRRPYAPSIDRIDSRAPYSFDNCRLVCVAVNIAVNEWGIETFSKFAAALRRKR